MDDSPWKKIKLSLERPYKNDRGEYLPVLLDITPDGEHIYEPFVAVFLAPKQ
jgi:mediator of RNA polymerase II transcription subunit 17